MTGTGQNIILGREQNLAVRKSDKKQKLLDIVRNDLRVKHYSRKTEESYISWIKQYIIFNQGTSL